MKLYDVFYKGAAFDSARRLPEPRNDIAYARNVNGEGDFVIPVGGKWVEVTREEALARAE